MKSDSGLIQNVEYSPQPGTDLSRQAETPGFSPGKRSGRPGQLDVRHSQFHHDFHPGENFFLYPGADLFIGTRKFKGSQLLPQHPCRKRADLMNIHSSNFYGKAFFFQPAPFTERADIFCQRHFPPLIHECSEAEAVTF